MFYDVLMKYLCTSNLLQFFGGMFSNIIDGTTEQEAATEVVICYFRGIVFTIESLWALKHMLMNIFVYSIILTLVFH